MNDNQHTIRILCYGDSNTWGRTPVTWERYDSATRWTGRLQKTLGNKYEVIEEGLNGRTVNLDYPENEGKNGETYLKPCMQTHSPLDIVILRLGTNDLQHRFDRTPAQIAQGIDTLLKIIHNPEYNYHKDPKVILLSPPLVIEDNPIAQQYYQGAGSKSKQLAQCYKELAEKEGCAFVDTTKLVPTSEKDGSHLSPESHKKISEVLAETILAL